MSEFKLTNRNMVENKLNTYLNDMKLNDIKSNDIYRDIIDMSLQNFINVYSNNSSNSNTLVQKLVDEEFTPHILTLLYIDRYIEHRYNIFNDFVNLFTNQELTLINNTMYNVFTELNK